MTAPAAEVDVEVIELDQPTVQVVEVGTDNHAVPVYIPGAGSSSGGNRVVVHEQTIPATVWGPIVHNLGRRPAAWSLFDDQGRECGQYVVQHLDENQLRVSMDVPTAGTFRAI